MGVHLSKNWEKSVLFLMKTFFWSSPEFGEKSVPFAFFFILHQISKLEQHPGRGSSPPMLKIGQNWGKIANYPLQCSTQIGPTVSDCNECSLKRSASEKNKNERDCLRV